MIRYDPVIVFGDLAHSLPLDLLTEPSFNPLGPNIKMQILQTDLYTFP